MATVFTRIIEGEFPAAFVWQDESCAAFMAKDALRPGHVLVVPREEVDYWADASDEVLDHLRGVARKLAAAITRAYGCARVAVLIVGLEVPHLHIHLVPVDSVHDVDFSRVRPDVPMDELLQNADTIKAALGELA